MSSGASWERTATRHRGQGHLTNCSKEPIPRSWLSKDPTPFITTIDGEMRFVRETIGCIAEKLMNGKATVAMIAAECGVSIGQVSRIGHRINGVRRYHERRRERRTPTVP